MRRAAIGDEQIIDGVEGDGRAQQTFDLVQKIRGNVRRYPDGWGEAAPLTGLLYCADCGGKMYVHRTNNGKRISQYTCSQYIKVPCGTLCKTQHRINEDVVLSLVSEMLKAIAEYAKYDRAEFVRVVQEVQSSQQTTEVKKQRTRLAAARQRASGLEVLLFEHCAKIDEAARNRMELIVPELAKRNGVTEQLKAENQMEWVRQMNACKAQAEEIVKFELIYD